MMSLFKKTMPFWVGLLLAGCTSTVVPVATEPDPVGLRIAQAAEKASSALDTIAGVEQARSPATPEEPDYSSAPPALMERISVRWSGPIEKIAQALAARAGLQFRVLGSTPPVPLTVTVDVYQKPMLDVLRDLGLQAGHRADVKIDPMGNMIEIRYAPSDRM